jgi:hypothetical protein
MRHSSSYFLLPSPFLSFLFISLLFLLCTDIYVPFLQPAVIKAAKPFCSARQFVEFPIDTVVILQPGSIRSRRYLRELLIISAQSWIKHWEKKKKKNCLTQSQNDLHTVVT